EKSCIVRRTFGSVLIYMRRHRLLVDDISHDALPIHASGRNNVERSRVELPTTVADDVNDHLLPAVLTSRLAAIVLTQIANILHDALHSPCNRLSSSSYMIMTMDSSTRRSGLSWTRRGTG